MVYEKVIVMGSGKIASECIDMLTAYTDSIICIEYENHPLSFVKSICSKKNIEYNLITSKEELSKYLVETSDKTLIISANNNFIFSEEVLSNKKLKVINFHNALLPYHRGRNSQTWAIFYMDETTGITWHEVDNGIDTGHIIIQKKIPIDSQTTALQLTRCCMEVGAKAFGECIESVINEDYEPKQQNNNIKGKLHHSRSVPNNGIIDFSWGIDKISAFLRSLDYGKLQIFCAPKISVLGEDYIVTNYKIEHSNSYYSQSITFISDSITFTDKGISLLIKLSPT